MCAPFDLIRFSNNSQGDFITVTNFTVRVIDHWSYTHPRPITRQSNTFVSKAQAPWDVFDQYRTAVTKTAEKKKKCPLLEAAFVFLPSPTQPGVTAHVKRCCYLVVSSHRLLKLATQHGVKLPSSSPPPSSCPSAE